MAFWVIKVKKRVLITLDREREFEVVIKFAARVSMHQLRELLSGKQVDTPQEALTVIDIVLRELAAQRCICVSTLYPLPPFELNEAIAIFLFQCFLGLILLVLHV